MPDLLRMEACSAHDLMKRGLGPYATRRMAATQTKVLGSDIQEEDTQTGGSAVADPSSAVLLVLGAGGSRCVQGRMWGAQSTCSGVAPSAEQSVCLTGSSASPPPTPSTAAPTTAQMT
jgi:hypothetical protein